MQEVLNSPSLLIEPFMNAADELGIAVNQQCPVKANIHIGFDLNHGIPNKLFLTDGKGDERPFVGKIRSPGVTAVMDS